MAKRQETTSCEICMSTSRSERSTLLSSVLVFRGAQVSRPFEETSEKIYMEFLFFSSPYFMSGGWVDGGG